MNRTKTILTSFSLALACTGIGCSGTLDGAEDGLTLNQVVDDDSRVDVDGGVSTVDAGRVRHADAGDAGDAGTWDDDGEGRGVDGNGDGKGCRWREAWKRHHSRRSHGHGLDGGLGIPGFPGSDGDHEGRGDRERPRSPVAAGEREGARTPRAPGNEGARTSEASDDDDALTPQGSDDDGTRVPEASGAPDSDRTELR